MLNAVLAIHFAQTGEQVPTTGAQSVDPKIETLTAALKTIRDRADAALQEIVQSAGEQRALSWKCSGCGHVKHFTRPVPAEVAAPCPKCHGTAVVP